MTSEGKQPGHVLKSLCTPKQLMTIFKQFYGWELSKKLHKFFNERENNPTI
jgi:hypothetical protein